MKKGELYAIIKIMFSNKKNFCLQWLLQQQSYQQHQFKRLT